MCRLKGEGFAKCARLQGGRERNGREKKDPGLCQDLEENGSRIEDWCQAEWVSETVLRDLPCSQGLGDCGTVLDSNNGVDR